MNKEEIIENLKDSTLVGYISSETGQYVLKDHPDAVEIRENNVMVDAMIYLLENMK